MIVSWQM